MLARHLRLVLLAATVAAGACSPTAEEGTPGGGKTGGKTGTGTGGRSGSGGSSSPGSGGSSSGTGGSTVSTGGSTGSSGGTAGSSSGTGGGAGSPTGSGGSGAGGASGDAGGETPPSNPGTFPPGPHKVVLITGDTANPNDPSRLQMIEILNSMKATHGIVLEEIAANTARPAALMDRALIIASPNANYFSVTPDPGFKTLPVPMIISKDGNTTQFGIGTMVNTANYTSGFPLKINIINPDHPLAAGLTGSVGIFTSANRYVRGRNLGPGAIKIATTPEEPNASWGIFAYEKGGELPGGVKAPAKRVGWVWHRPSGVTPEGRKLFIAAVEWALRP